MIKKLKNRPRSDSFDREPQRVRRQWDRLVYLVMLAGFLTALLNYTVGDLVFLRADGLVLRTRGVVAATSLVQVRSIDVTPGQRVHAGDRLLHAESFEILDRIAEFSILEAELAEREAALRTQMGLAESLLPLIQKRAVELKEIDTALDGARVSGLVTATRRESVTENLYDTNVELITLTAQFQGFAVELAAVIKARSQARQALDDLTKHYASGVYRAGTVGVIGDTVPALGEVFNPGEPILTVMSGKPYILAYLPSRHLFPVRPGDRVNVTGGTLRRQGMIERILPVSQSVPDEFRNAFRLDETLQLARISLDSGEDFPIFSTVHIRRYGPWGVVSQTFRRMLRFAAPRDKIANYRLKTDDWEP